jgi:hypothetical protein
MRSAPSLGRLARLLRSNAGDSQQRKSQVAHPAQEAVKSRLVTDRPDKHDCAVILVRDAPVIKAPGPAVVEGFPQVDSIDVPLSLRFLLSLAVHGVIPPRYRNRPGVAPEGCIGRQYRPGT